MGGWQLEWQEKCQPTYRGNRFDLDKESGIKGGNLDLDNNEGIFIHNFKSEVLYLILAITKHIFTKLEISISPQLVQTGNEYLDRFNGYWFSSHHFLI